MILRIWHGWATADTADAYQRLVDEQVVPGIMDRGIPGLRHVDIVRRRGEVGGEVEFATIMAFDDWAAIEAFAGPGGTTSYVPTEARRLLSRFDDHSQHYDLVAAHNATTSSPSP